MSRSVDLAVVGATSAVGETVLQILRERAFPVGKIYALDGAASAGSLVGYGNRELTVEDLAGFDFTRVPLALFAAGAAVASEYAPKAAAAGCVVIDGSAQFRLDADVPLVIPEVNPDALAGFRSPGIVASPDSATIQMLVALKPIHDAAGLARINVCTYQSVSGSGKDGIEELGKQTADLLSFRGIEPKVYSRQIAFNVIPHIGAFEDNGYTGEEMGMVRATQKILDDETVLVNPTAVRVPVFYGHAQALHIETRRKLGAGTARTLLAQAPGLMVIDERTEGGYPTPVGDASGEDTVMVGRIREDFSHPHGLNLWVVADNLRKGAALNAVQIAEALIRSSL